MKKVLSLLFFTLLSQIVFCQRQDRVIDSLTHVLKTAKEDTAKVSTLLSLSKNLWLTGELYSAMNYAQDALFLSEKIKFNRGIGDANNSIGVIYTDQGNYSEALKNFIVSLSIAKEVGDKQGIAIAYGNIGNVDNKLGNYKDALENFEESLSLAKEIKDKQIMVVTYNNIGIILESQKNYSEALKNYSASLLMAEEMDDKENMSTAHNNIGVVYFKQGNYQEAMKSYQASLSISEKIRDKNGVAIACINLGGLSVRLNKYDAAKEYLNRALMISKTVGSKDVIMDSYLNLSQMDSVKGNYKKAYQYYQQYTKMKDSILNETSYKHISQLKIQYETEKKDNQIKTAQLKNNILQTQIYYGIALSILVISIIVLLYYLSYSRNRRKKKEYEHTLTDLELTVLKAQLNPHFISNSLSAIKNFIDEQPGKASQFLLKFARLMRRVLEQNEHQLISLREELETIELYMQIESLRLRYGFDFYFNCDPSIDQDVLLVPPLILQPTIENAIWHGLAAKSEKGEIIINIYLEKELLKFIIEDNGTGQELEKKRISTHLEDKKSFGIAITRKRIEIMSKELKNQGYYQLNFFEGRTITEIALPVNYS